MEMSILVYLLIEFKAWDMHLTIATYNIGAVLRVVSERVPEGLRKRNTQCSFQDVTS